MIKYIVAHVLSRNPFNETQETTHKYTYQKQIMSEINDIEELPEGIISINLNLIKTWTDGT